MKKKWYQNYLLIGTLVVIVIALVCSFAFTQSNIRQLEQKHVFESIYKDTKIDFIIPSPADNQIGELESNNAIKSVTPYYETATKATINGAAASGTTLMFPYEGKMEQTPYCQTRVIAGDKQYGVGDAVIDRAYAEKNGCKVGDKVQLTLGGSTVEYTIAAIAETNTYYNDGTVAFVLKKADAEGLTTRDTRYSAAYVEAADKAACKTFLEHEYKPLGRLKNKADFSSEEAYNQHVQNFNDADWSKEITNCEANYNSLKVKYANVESSATVNLIIAAVIVALAIIIFNVVVIQNGTLKKIMREVLVKKNGTKKDLAAFFSHGIILNLIEFVVLYCGLYFLIVKSNGAAFLNYYLQAIIPVGVAVIASITMMASAKAHVEKTFTTKKQV